MTSDPRSALAREHFKLPPKWEWKWLDEVLEIKGGAQPPASEFSDYCKPGYVRFIQIRDFDSGAYLTFIPDSPKWRKCCKGDVMIARYGASLGRVLRGLEGAYNVALVKAVPKDGIDNDYMYYLLTSHFFQDSIQGVGDRSVQAGFNKKDISTMAVPIPPFAEQKIIARILLSLDQKIALNEQMNKTLESTTRLIFKSWFVDFDPVRSKVEGKHPFGMDSETAALFSDDFESSELGEAPKGWQVVTLTEVLLLAKEGIAPGAFPDEHFDHYSIPAFDDGLMPKVETGDSIKSNKTLVTEDAVLISKLNPRTPRIWIPRQHPENRSICSTEFLVCLPKNGATTEYLWALLGSPSFLAEFSSFVTGTSGSHQRVQPKAMLNMRIVVPPSEVIDVFTRMISPLVQLIRSNREEVQTLRTLRDALLPKLLSGEVLVSDIGSLTTAND